MKRWRGVVHLVRDAVEHGSAAVEHLQKQALATPFRVLEALPGIALPARRVHAVHDGVVSGVHGLVRLVNRGVGVTADVVLDALEARAAARQPPPQEP
ncbi:hypothetical protein FGE12_12170 [Aggregicoccus sp. 17bor-14]|uniref:hypothetical protein n=1 Tax=Myxococcaceae TaxID=31 RepID=UPI00129D0286|nr:MULTISPECIES: hypothetical protein [Myxococcaceae]MBF5043145.1 hypothetical protein [Simulacricoccus sp. 17bor-14]MRI88905.1 hypothetical protein [Aggregicoccus sp. 17bor-14]